MAEPSDQVDSSVPSPSIADLIRQACNVERGLMAVACHPVNEAGVRRALKDLGMPDVPLDVSERVDPNQVLVQPMFPLNHIEVTMNFKPEGGEES